MLHVTAGLMAGDCLEALQGMQMHVRKRTFSWPKNEWLKASLRLSNSGSRQQCGRGVGAVGVPCCQGGQESGPESRRACVHATGEMIGHIYI